MDARGAGPLSFIGHLRTKAVGSRPMDAASTGNSQLWGLVIARAEDPVWAVHPRGTFECLT